MTQRHHRRHVEMHAMLDELVADWLTETGKRPSESSVWELIEWSNAQTKVEVDEPDEVVEKPADTAPSRVGVTHIRFTDHKGIERVMRVEKIELLHDRTKEPPVFGCSGFYVTANTFEGVCKLLDPYVNEENSQIPVDNSHEDGV